MYEFECTSLGREVGASGWFIFESFACLKLGTFLYWAYVTGYCLCLCQCLMVASFRATGLRSLGRPAEGFCFMGGVSVNTTFWKKVYFEALRLRV